MSVSRTAKRWLYWSHRWTGIALCLVFAVWFVSGVVMMYVPFPSFRAPERIAGAPPIDWGRVAVTPGEALATLGLKQFPSELRLETMAGDPVYRTTDDAGRRAVSAVTGREITAVDAPQAARIAAAFTHAAPQSVTPVSHDQWVVTRAYAKIAPFWRVRMNDAAATDIYVSRRTGEIVQNTTAYERGWNWLGAVPHWLYFEALRVHQEPWRQTVLWASGIGMIGAIAGIWIGILRVRIAKPYKSGSVSPYRGWMKWHHIVGLVGGLFLVTWVFSGWLSMSRWGGFRNDNAKAIAARYDGVTPGFPAPDRAALRATGAHELHFGYLGGASVVTVHGGPQDGTLLDGSTAQPLHPSQPQITAIAAAAMGSQPIAVQRLTRHDLYWYTTGDPRSDARPLPILRLIFADPARTWLHIDPATGALLGQSTAATRSYRWLFSALHSFDLPWLLAWRPLRDGLMWLLSAAGLFIAISGIVVGLRHLWRAQRSRHLRKPRSQP